MDMSGENGVVRHTFISDADAKTDALEFKPYVEGLASLITNPDTETPLTVGVLGSWGTGKTSLLRQLRDTLEDPNGPAPFDGRSDNHTLWLNVWELSLQGNLTRSFLQALLTD